MKITRKDLVKMAMRDLRDAKTREQAALLAELRKAEDALREAMIEDAKNLYGSELRAVLGLARKAVSWRAVPEAEEVVVSDGPLHAATVVVRLTIRPNKEHLATVERLKNRVVVAEDWEATALAAERLLDKTDEGRAVLAALKEFNRCLKTASCS